jgi:hypothetical protein
MVSGDPIGFDPDDTTGMDKWNPTIITDSIFTVKADESGGTIEIEGNMYGKYERTYTFFVRAVDNRGMRSEAAHRSFTAFNLAPYAVITFPRNTRPGQAQFLNPVVTFEWDGKDPIDTPWNYQEIDSVRYLVDFHTVLTMGDLNEHPEKYELKWSPWIWYHTQGDSGKHTIVGDDEILRLNRIYFFAVQAKDEAGAITSIFDYRTNVFVFMPLDHDGPELTVYTDYFGDFRFIGTNYTPAKIRTMAGLPLDFSWSADARRYGGLISTYRYGWDVADLSKPEDWDVYPGPQHTSCPTKKHYMGVHTLYIEVADNFGNITLGQIEVSIFPLLMTKNLLWVDDFPSGEFHQEIYAMPRESKHDKFWIDICSRAEGFDPENDVFDCQHSAFYPDLEYIAKYKNIIWTYSSEYRTTVWDDIVEFVGSYRDNRIEGITFNYLATYIRMGGHVWTLGKSDRGGGFAAVLASVSQQFPINLRCEIFGPTSGCPDTIGTACTAYRDYCISVLDKVRGVYRTGPDVPYRNVDRDAMSYCIKDETDPLTLSHPELPEQLELWDKITEPDNYFDPRHRGFLYVEAYNPQYWMIQSYSRTQSCFHPMYRMRTRHTFSCLNNAVVAFWTTKYADVVAEAPGTVAAPSVHFGFPLWFFNRAQANLIADAIFEEWQIKPVTSSGQAPDRTARKQRQTAGVERDHP